jgi:chaperone required for assembly of F1-ATPase
MKRNYVRVSVVDVPEGLVVALDDRPISTPGKWPLIVPTRDLADAIADEWRRQGSQIRPSTMPLMQLAATVLDHVVVRRDDVETATLRYAETDAVCYRADQPAELVRLQSAVWDPLLAWLADAYGAKLEVVTGILPIPQPPDALERLSAALSAMDNWRLCAFQAATSSCGSFVIALALLDGRIDAEEAFRAAEIDASFEIERWGEDGEAIARRERVAADLAAASRFTDLLGH